MVRSISRRTFGKMSGASAAVLLLPRCGGGFSLDRFDVKPSVLCKSGRSSIKWSASDSVDVEAYTGQCQFAEDVPDDPGPIGTVVKRRVTDPQLGAELKAQGSGKSGELGVDVEGDMCVVVKRDGKVVAGKSIFALDAGDEHVERISLYGTCQVNEDSDLGGSFTPRQVSYAYPLSFDLDLDVGDGVSLLSYQYVSGPVDIQLSGPRTDGLSPGAQAPGGFDPSGRWSVTLLPLSLEQACKDGPIVLEFTYACS